MSNSTDTETLRQFIATVTLHAERAAAKADRNETAIRDLQQDFQYLGTQMGRVERRLDDVDGRMDSLETGQQRIEAIALQILEKLEGYNG